MEPQGRTSTPTSTPTHSKFAEAMILGGNALDGATSAYALAHGAREAYPFMPSTPFTNALMKAGATVGEIMLVRRLEDEGHPKAAKVAATILGGLAGGAGISNLHQISKMKD